MIAFERAECHDVDSAMSHANTAEAVQRAKTICARCDVRMDCLAQALRAQDNLEGIWGGLTATERDRYKRADFGSVTRRR
jgi:WhiB family redox-sensing transcriptional regulator